MLPAIVQTALRFRGLVLALAAVFTIAGIVTVRNAPVDVFPEFSPPYLEIQTESLGLSAPEVEQLLTVPMEADLLNGVEGVDVLRSKSTAGLSDIVMVFKPGFDIYKGRQLVQERLTQLNGAAFAHVSKAPVVLPPLSSASRVMAIGLSGKSLTPIQRSVIAWWTIRPKILGIQGVSDASIWGLRDQQLQVQINPDKLHAAHLTLSQIVATAGNAQVSSPVTYLEAAVPGTGGFIETPEQRLPIRNVFDNIASPKTLGNVPIEGTQGAMRLHDVANVVTEHQPLIGDSIINGRDTGQLMIVEKFPGADTRRITKEIDQKLADLQSGLGGMKVDTHVYRPADVIERGIRDVLWPLGIGLLLAGIALYVVTRSFRRVLVSGVSVCVSLVVGAAVLAKLGWTFNTLSLTGLALAVVVIVDDAVAGVDALVHRGNGGDKFEIIRDAVAAARRPLAYATFMGAAAAIPLLVMEGRPGAFYRPLAIAFLIAIATGTLVSLVVTPTIAGVLPAKESIAPTGASRVSRWQEAALTWARNRTGLVVALGIILALASVAALPLLPNASIPEVKDRNVLVRFDAPPGTSNTKTTAIASGLATKIRHIDGVESVVGAVGRAITGDRVVDVNSGELIVAMKSKADWDDTYNAIDEAASSIKGANAVVDTNSDQHVRDVGGVTRGVNMARNGGLGIMTGVDQVITVRVFGQNPDELARQAKRVEAVVSNVDGVDSPSIESVQQQPTIDIAVDLKKSAQYGLKPGDVRRSEAIMLQGILVGSVFKDQKIFEVVVKGTPDIAKNIDSLRNLLLDTPDGSTVRLGDVAKVSVSKAPVVIERDAVSRKLDITVDVKGRSVNEVSNEIADRIDDLSMPLEYHAEVLKRTIDEEINFGQIMTAAIAAAAFALLLFQALLRNWGLSVGALIGVAAATFGGILATILLGDGLTVGSAAGLFAIAVLAARHAAVILRHLEEVDPEGDDSAAMVTVGLAPKRDYVLTSILTASAVLLPTALAGSRVGLELTSPMAWTVLGGFATLIIVDLVGLPVLYAFWRREGGTPPEELDAIDPMPSIEAGA